MKDQFIKQNIDFNRKINDIHIIDLDKSLFSGTIDSIVNSLALLKEEHGNDVMVKHTHCASQDAFSAGHDKYILVKPMQENDLEYDKRIKKEQKHFGMIFDVRAQAIVEKALNNRKLSVEEKEILASISPKVK
jgi:hypothetical protein